jgi:DNA-binding NarL/FixJ family response regulator
MNGSREMSLVLANDVPFLSGLMRLAVSDSGFTVVGEANQKSQLIELCELERPDVVIVDMQLPEKEIIHLIEQILDFDVRMAIIVITEAGEGLGEKIMASGARAYLQKPYTTYDLLDMIRKVAPILR